MKLEKYEDKSRKKRKIVIISISVIVLISISFLLYKTFASLTESAEFPMMKGQVDYFGNSDVYFAFYQGDKKLEEMPKKDNEENLVFDHAECDNGASIEWNKEEWAPLVKKLKQAKTKCSLYFKKSFEKELVKCGQSGISATECIKNNANLDTVNLMTDDTNEANIRYVGASPNNFIDIGDKDGDGNPILWRIIGVMNNITNLDNGGRRESLLKIIRAESIGDYSWDSSSSGINTGHGVNEWSEADVMKLLNPNTVYSGTPAIGGSLYWNRGSGNCYNARNEGNSTCDFTSSGLSETAKNKIVKVRWNTGTAGETYDSSNGYGKITAKYMYESEQSSHNGKEQCENTKGVECNDEISRKTTWDGYVGLMYPSDYGYAVGGETRDVCLERSMTYYNVNCYENDWLFKGSDVWTMIPVPNSTFAYFAFRLRSAGNIYNEYCSNLHWIMPVVYITPSTKIIGGTGEIDSPFIAQ